jgi:galactose-1-phosphate uridylyltransferase
LERSIDVKDFICRQWLLLKLTGVSEHGTRTVVPNMAAIPVAGYQALWTEKRQTIKSEYQRLVRQFRDTDAQLKLLFKVLCDIKDVARYTPASVGESEQWSSIVSAEEGNSRELLQVPNRDDPV